MIPTTPLQDPEIYPNPEKFDGYRFFRLRQEAGNEHRFQFAAPTPEHFAFGYGKHACPGRFFASNQVKVMLMHLILKCDWRFPDEVKGRPKSLERGAEIAADPSVKLLYRTRTPEILL